MAYLNSANFRSVQGNNFAEDKSLNNFPLFWAANGDAKFHDDGVTLSAGGGGRVGFLGTTPNTYGLYQVTARLDPGQGKGACVVLWPADNAWPGHEIDLLESADPSRQSMFTTIHWDKGGRDAFHHRTMQVDTTQWHTYAYNWQPGRLTYYIDGEEMFSTTERVPNEPVIFGAQVTDASGRVNLHVRSMSISKPVDGGDAQVPASSLTGKLLDAATSPVFQRVSLNDKQSRVTANGQKPFLVAYGGGSGRREVDKFSVDRGDMVQLPSSMKSSLQQDVSGGDTILSGGSGGGELVLHGVTSLPSSAIHFSG
ncbi:Glycoside hydrolase family 16 protein [Rhodovastum atsumiense]|nr:glycoside hydrolase family 16 protein [Rhodovastum atsumiense]CAH2598629.1 Glycoside hydrolase family 16 protein [Rhodovastum atsumiense]